MAKYEVLVQRVQGINKNTYEAGQKVTDEMFPAGVAEKLEKDGKLKLIQSNELEPVEPVKPVEPVEIVKQAKKKVEKPE